LDKTFYKNCIQPLPKGLLRVVHVKVHNILVSGAVVYKYIRYNKSNKSCFHDFDDSQTNFRIQLLTF